MLNLKKGYPEEGELLMCTITKIHYHSVFAQLDEYERRQGLIHISEVSPGRIRNIGDYVQEGKKVVCKVLRIDDRRGHIDLSLRRVSTMQKRSKVEDLKQEQKSEKIIEYVAGQLKMKAKELNDKVAPKLLEKYPSLHAAFEDVSFGDLDLKSLGVEERVAKDLTEIIKQRIKPPIVQVLGDLKLLSYDDDGLEVVKEVLMQAHALSEDVKIAYLGGGKYSIVVTKNDYKDAEADLKAVLEFLEKKAKEKKLEMDFKRKESRKIKS